MDGWVTRRRDNLMWVWSDRYLILDGNKLLLFKRKSDPTPRRTILLTPSCSVAEIVGSNERHSHKHSEFWILRLQFSADAVDDRSEKEKFIEFGTKTKEEAEKWKLAIENAILLSIAQREERNRRAVSGKDIGNTPATVQALLEGDGSFDSEPFLTSSDQSVESETVWRILQVESGLRILKEYPRDDELSASKIFDNAKVHNSVTRTSAVIAVIGALIFGSFDQGVVMVIAVAVLIALLATVMQVGSIRLDSIPSLKVSEVVRGDPESAFRAIMDRHLWRRWDGAAASQRLLEEVDDHTDVLHLVMRPVWIWPTFYKPRDLVLTRYWRKEEDGTYLVIYQSTTHPKAEPTSKYVRGNLAAAAFVIAPRKKERSQLHEPESMLTYVVRYDPCGWGTWWTQFGKGLDFVLPQLRNVIAIKDELANNLFIEPVISTSGTDQKSTRTSVDNRGLVLGVPKLDCSAQKKFWAEPDASKFHVRGESYLHDRKKVPAGRSVFNLVAIDVQSFEDSKDRINIASQSHNIIYKLNANVKPGEPQPAFTFVVNFIVPGSDTLAITCYFQPTDPEWKEKNPAFAELLSDFMEAGDDFRNNRFKLIPSIVEGSFIIKQAVGTKPAIIGNKGLTMRYFKGDNWFEVDIDIDSDPVARNITGMCLGVTKSLVVDMAFLIESQTDEELPEIIIGVARFHRIDLKQFRRIPRMTS